MSSKKFAITWNEHLGTPFRSGLPSMGRAGYGETGGYAPEIVEADSAEEARRIYASRPENRKQINELHATFTVREIK